MARRRTGNERYHDRVASRYDGIYDNDPYWDLVRDLVWERLKPLRPQRHGAAVLDAGCGTGIWGARLAKSGYRLTYLDLSDAMLEQARQRHAAQAAAPEATFLRADIGELDPLPDGGFALVLALGDPLSFTDRADRALGGIARLLEPGGRLVASVDHRHGATGPFLERGDLEGLARFLEDGRSHWLTRDAGERFPTSSFTADGLVRMAERAGLAVESVHGLPVFPWRAFRKLLEDPAARARAIALESAWSAERTLFAGAGHLLLCARKP